MILCFLIISDQPILADSINTIYATEGSTINLTIKVKSNILFSSNGHTYSSFFFTKNRTDHVIRPDSVEFQIINLTANDTGLHSITDWDFSTVSQLSVTSMFIVTCY